MATKIQPNETDEAVRQFVKNFFREREAQGERPAQLARRLGRHVGKSAGFSRATMTEIGSDRRGIGKDMRRAVAAELFDGSIDQLERQAVEWWVANRERIEAMQRGKYSTVERTYPNRGEALDRMDSVVDQGAIDFVRQLTIEPGKKDPPILEWMRVLMEEHYRRARGVLPPTKVRSLPTLSPTRKR